MYIWVILLSLHTQTCTITLSHLQACTRIGNFWERACQRGAFRAKVKLQVKVVARLIWSSLCPTCPEKTPHLKWGQQELEGLAASLHWWEGKWLSETPRVSPRRTGEREQRGSGEGHPISPSRCARSEGRGEDMLAEVVQQPLPSTSLHGSGQPVRLRSLLAPSAKWRCHLCEMLWEYEVLAILILFTGIFVPLSATEACY